MLRKIVLTGLKDVEGVYRPPWYMYLLIFISGGFFAALGAFLIAIAFGHDEPVKAFGFGSLLLAFGILYLCMINAKITITDEWIRFRLGVQKFEVNKVSIIAIDVVEPKRRGGAPYLVICDGRVIRIPLYKSLLRELKRSYEAQKSAGVSYEFSEIEL